MIRAARRILEKLRADGHEAFFAGGWVRDHLLRRKATDIDIATSALPGEILGLFRNARPIGVQFGVVQVTMYGRPFEVATFRREGPYLDGRHPASVSFSSPRQDALRRDFTINGLFYDPAADRVIDHVRGKADIRRRIIRTIGKPRDRFSEDKLRMLRAIRLSAELKFEIEPETMAAIVAGADEILQVSWERIRDELFKILAGSNPGLGLDLLDRSGILLRILPEVHAMRGIEQPPEFHPEGDVFVHTRLMLDIMRRPSAEFALAVLLHDVGKPPTFSIRERIRFDGHVEVGTEMAGEICRRLRLSNEQTAYVEDLVRNHLRFMHVKEMRESTLRRFLQKPDFADHLELHRIDCLASHGDLESFEYCRRKQKELRFERAASPPLISGHDLIALGYTPGPLFKKILQTIEDLQLERRLGTREEALRHVLQAFPRAEDILPESR